MSRSAENEGKGPKIDLGFESHNDETRCVIEEYNRLDIELYGYACYLVGRLRRDPDAEEGLAQ